jgi:hypothetical protein
LFRALHLVPRAVLIPVATTVAVLETSPAAADYRLKFARWTLVAGVGFYIVLVAFALFSTS